MDLQRTSENSLQLGQLPISLGGDLSTCLEACQELWKEIVGCPGYQISTLGRVRSVRKIMSPCLNAAGYYELKIKNKNLKKRIRIHREVAKAFIPQPERMHIVCHIDGNPKNNIAANLYWGNYKLNTADAIRHGTLIHGQRSPKAILTDNDVRAIRLIGRRKPTHKLAELFGVSEDHIRQIISGAKWKLLDRDTTGAN